MQHITVYKERDRFAGWPANYGIWSWGNEVVCGFTVGHLSRDPSSGFHARDSSKPFLPMQARSLDGGQTWDVSPTPCPLPGGKGISADEHVEDALKVSPVVDSPGALLPPPGNVDFSHPDFALMCARSGLEAGARSWFYTSTDRCHSWQGPYELPMFGLLGIAARTDYVITNANTCTLFLTSAKSDGQEGTVFCARTIDGAKSFAYHSAVGPEPDEGHAIMPASVLLPNGEWLVAIRRRKKPNNTIELFASHDDAKSWEHRAMPVQNTGRGGNPPTLTLLADGRLCIVYGYREQPCGIRAVTSENGGKTWSSPIVLRDDAGNYDIGYPRTVALPDGKLLSVYYYNDHPQEERYIAGTIWQP